MNAVIVPVSHHLQTTQLGALLCHRPQLKSAIVTVYSVQFMVLVSDFFLTNNNDLFVMI